MDAPREIRIHPSVHRPRLILGADRELVIFLGLLSSILIFVLVTWWSVVIGVLLWLVGVSVLVAMGREDVLLRHVYLRHVKYRAFYPAKAGIDSSATRLARTWSK
jgi:type IV secretion system protein VirB3